MTDNHNALRLSALAAMFLFGCSFGLSAASALAQDDPKPEPVVVPVCPVCPVCDECDCLPPPPAPKLSPEDAAAVQKALDAIKADEARQKAGPNP